MIPLGRRRPATSRPGGAPAQLLLIGARPLLVPLLLLLLLLVPLLLINLRGGATQEVHADVVAGRRQVEAQELRRARRHHQPTPANWAHNPSAFGEQADLSQPLGVQRVINDAQVIQSERRNDEVEASIRRRRRRRPVRHLLRPERPIRRAEPRVQQEQPQQKQQQQRALSHIVQSSSSRVDVLSNSSGGDGSESASMMNLIRRRRNQAQATSNSSVVLAGRKQQASNGGFSRRLQQLRQKYRTNQAVSGTPYYVLLVIYASFITFGTISNFLICLTVILKPKILSPRNIFIVNLAGSDLLLCVFTMPFSFIELSMKMWQLGKITCKLVAGLQATSIFVSTISITAIAIDRYKVIVYPTHKETASGARGAALLVGSVWIGALALSSPLFGYRTVERMNELIHDRANERVGSGGTLSNSSATTLADDYQNNNGSSNQQLLGSGSSQEAVPELIEFCVERWPFAHGRGLYSVISMICQYVLPITIVSVVYTQISRKLQKRLIRRQRLTQLECQQKRQLNLIRRTHTMLISVSLVFGLSWLPLNLLNVVSDFSPRLLQLLDDQSFRVIFAACHLIGCSSACSNPILYAFLNENFRKEFRQVYDQHARHIVQLLRRLCCCQPPDDATTRLDYELRRGSAAKQLEPPVTAAPAPTVGGGGGGDTLPDDKLRVGRQLNHSLSASLDFSTSDTGNSSMSGSLDDNEDDDDDEGDDDQQSAGSGSSHAPLARKTCVISSNRNHSSLVNLSCAMPASSDGALLETSKSTRSLATASARHPSLLVPPDSVSNIQLNEVVASVRQPTADSSQNRKSSFQTVASSGRQTMSKTLRFCLCLSDSSLSSDAPESTANNNNNNNNNRRHSIKMAQMSEANGAPPSASEVERRASERKRRRAKRRRRLRQQMLQLECECQCHKLERPPLEANEEVQIKSPSRKAEMLLEPTAAEQMAEQRASRQETRRENAVVGRRVWLRFLGGLSSQEGASSEAQDKSCDNRLVKDTGERQTAIELVGDTRPTYEIDEQAAPGERAPTPTTKAPKRAHCNNCKHSSDSSRMRLAAGAERRRKRPNRGDSARQLAVVKDQALNKVAAAVPLPLKSPIHSGALATIGAERRKRRFQLPKWMSFSRSSGGGGGVERDRSSASSKRLAATKSLAGKVNGLPSTGKQNSSTSSFVESSKLGRALRQASFNWSADEQASVANSRSPDRSALAAASGQSVRKSGSSSSRLTAASAIGPLQHHQQQQQSKVLSTAITTTATTANKGVNSPGGKQVGTVYLSIETGERSRVDSLVSLSREKSTSVVVIGAEEEDEEAKDELAARMGPVEADRPVSAMDWDYRGNCKLDASSASSQRRRASHDDAQINDEPNNLRPLSPGTHISTQAGANQCANNESGAESTPLPASQSEIRAAPRIQLCNAHQQQHQPSADIDASTEAEAAISHHQATGELQSSSASSSSYILSAGASSAHSSSCTCSSASTASSCQWPASQLQQHQHRHHRKHHLDQHNRASACRRGITNQAVAYECAESREHNNPNSAAQTSATANFATKRALQQHQSLTVVTGSIDFPSPSKSTAAVAASGEPLGLDTARPHHHSVHIGHQTARGMHADINNSSGDPLDNCAPVGLRGQRTYSATTGNETMASAQRVALAASAAYRAAQRTIVGAGAMKSPCSSSLVALGLGASGSARPGLCGQNRSVANLNERSTATNTCGTTCGTATTASSCSLFTTTTTSHSSFSGDLCGHGEESIDFDECQPTGGVANTAASERSSRNQVCHQPASGASSAATGSSATKPVAKLEHTAPSLA